MGLESMMQFERNCSNVPGAAGDGAASASILVIMRGSKAIAVAAAAPAAAPAAAAAAAPAAAPAVPGTFWQNPGTPGPRYPLAPG